jgi:acetolactate synthase-1/2/3 large subunit
LRGADLLVQELLAGGIDTVFGLPGIQIMAAFDALHRARDRLRLITTRHEQSAAYMAFGYGRVTNRPACCLVVPGPGVLNAAAGLGTAYASSVPFLLVSGQIPLSSIGRQLGQLHEIDDQLDVLRSLTAWSHRITSVDALSGAIRRAFRHLRAGRRRTVELEIPPEILAQQTGDSPPDLESEAMRADIDPGALQAARELLMAAHRPVIVAGGGTIVADAGDEVLQLAELLDAPVITTQHGKGIIPEDHDRAIGVTQFELLGPAYEVLPHADVVVAVGTRLFIRSLVLPDSVQVIHIDIDPGAIGRSFGTAVGIVGDARHALGELLELVREERQAGPSRRRAEIAAHKRKCHDEIRKIAPTQTAIIEQIRAALARDAIVVSGMNNIGYWAHVALPVYEPRTYVAPSYFGALGFAFPAALGAKVAFPDRQVVAITGDGGFLYCSEELATAVQYGINVVTLLFNNHSYGASEMDQIRLYHGREHGTRLHNPDFVRLAEAYGAFALRAEPDRLAVVIRRALEANRPAVVVVDVGTEVAPFQLGRRPS